MTALRRSLARVHGPAAITVWSWLLTLPFALTVMSGLQYVSGGPGAVLAVAGLQHGILGGLLLLGAAVLRVVPRGARPVAVFAIYAAIGAVRPLLFLEAGGLLGIPVAPGDLAGRIAVNVVVVVAVFALIAVAVDLVREHLGVFRRLRAAQRASGDDIGCATERLARLRSEALDDVVEALERTAATAAADLPEPAEAARLLRRLAEDVVRPASHRVYEDDGAAPGPDGEQVAPREWFTSVVGGMRAAPPLATALLFTAMVLPFVSILSGPAIVAPVAAGLVVLLIGGSLVASVTLPAHPAARLTVLLLLYIGVGLLVSATGAVGLALAGSDPAPAWFETATYPLIALTVALVSSLSVRVRQDQAELEAALQANVAAAARVRADYDRERATLARLLHAGVQSELIAGALALTAAPPADRAAAARRVIDVLGRARDALRGAHDERHAADEVSALLDSWSSAIELRVAVDEAVWGRLVDPTRASAVVDAVSEGLANAVRHGDGSPVAIALRAADCDGVKVVIESGGTLGAADSGIGLRQLAERGTVALREASGRVELAVAIP
ncbi:hypothetical protein [Leifsonia shinshuensis]|uniref:hypothetical protein n=1 Tax=Leifsonia shinshuensis TaxID=150026 RepID=UPI002855C5AC|nr:hypothetical protein [Leifsonia shinshuensis]MDR6972401.1 signal transduction histidine kinase [Leifsonia shinshuensis]